MYKEGVKQATQSTLEGYSLIVWGTKCRGDNPVYKAQRHYRSTTEWHMAFHIHPGSISVRFI